MPKLGFGSNVAVFLLFFGIAMLDAFSSHDWPRAALFLALAFVFLRADAAEEAGKEGSQLR